MIKFRAWDKDSKTMCTVRRITWTNGDITDVYLENIGLRRLDQVILMQYTGLKDKNCVEIYEGDILTTEQYPYQVEGEYNYHGVVEWDKESAGYIVVKYVVNPLISGISNGMADRFEEVDGFEVIGNIYENPELKEVAE